MLRVRKVTIKFGSGVVVGVGGSDNSPVNPRLLKSTSLFEPVNTALTN